MTGDVALPFAGQLIQLHDSIFRSSLLQVNHRITQKNTRSRIFIVAQSIEAIPCSFILSRDKFARRAVIIHTGAYNKENNRSSNHAQSNHHGNSFSYCALMPLPDHLCFRFQSFSFCIQSTLFLRRCILPVLLSRFRIETKSRGRHP